MTEKTKKCDKELNERDNDPVKEKMTKPSSKTL